MLKVYDAYEMLDVLPLDDIFEEFYLPYLPPISGGAVTVTPQSSPVAAKLIVDTDADGTAENNMTGTTGSIYMIDVDNSANGAASYLKLYDAAAPTIGTTAPDWIFKIAASTRSVIGCPGGLAFGTAISMACVTAGGTAGTTNPTSNVIARLMTS